MTREKLHTVSEVADILGVTSGRIRQICREYELGEVFARTRLLTESELEAIREIPDRRTKSKKIGKVA